MQSNPSPSPSQPHSSDPSASHPPSQGDVPSNDTSAPTIDSESTDESGHTTTSSSRDYANAGPVDGSEVADLLQQEEEWKLIDEIQRLRRLGVGAVVNLPQVVVCGDQSTGKSSVLEAITGISFPRASGTCTRFATQITLHRADQDASHVTIIPDPQRSQSERDRLKRYRTGVRSWAELPDLIHAASQEMGLNMDVTDSYSKDILNIDSQGPKRGSLMVIDLPGIRHLDPQDRGIVETVDDIVLQHVKNPRAIILAVVRADVDLVNQKVLKFVSKVDPQGERTLGIITMPDLALTDPRRVNFYLELAKNRDMNFRFQQGWHVLRNRSGTEQHLDLENRDRLESNFFREETAWRVLPEDIVGIGWLRPRLSRLMYTHFKKELPRVLEEIECKLEVLKEKVERLGPGRGTPLEMRLFLERLCTRMADYAKDAVRGHYESELFRSTDIADLGAAQNERLRNRIRDLHEKFHERVKTEGHHWQVEDRSEARRPVSNRQAQPQNSTAHGSSINTVLIPRDKMVELVSAKLKTNRGQELPGHHNPQLISDLFWEQSAKWEDIGKEHVTHVYEVCEEFLESGVNKMFPPDMSDRFQRQFLKPRLKECWTNAERELKQVFQDRNKPPQTLNDLFIQNLEKKRYEFMFTKVMEAIKTLEQSVPDNENEPGTDDLESLADEISAEYSSGANHLKSVAEDFLDSMLVFYDIAWEIFVNNVATQVVERHIIGDMHKLFEGESVRGLDEQIVVGIAQEDVQRRTERTTLKADIERLQNCLAAMQAR